ncbi:MAG: GNAT family N-acetyltransferase [Gemmatimonadota bacterium]
MATTFFTHKPLDAESTKQSGLEMSLIGTDLRASLSPGQRERIDGGRAVGLVMRRGRSESEITAHVALHVNALDRIALREENVARTFERATRAALLTTRTGELFQAMLGDEVVSSLLVLRYSNDAYCESSGDSDEGAKIGASHFLRYETALALQAENVAVLHFGAAAPAEAAVLPRPSLPELTAGASQSAPSLLARSRALARRKATTALSLIRDDPLELLFTLLGRPERYVAYVADPAQVPPADCKPGWELRKVDDGVLTELASARAEFRVQATRLAEGRVNDAYGLYIDHVLAGITWMIPAPHDAMYTVRNVKLRRDEVELTHCITLPEFRNRGVYTYMIRTLCAMAAKAGVRRVYMITNRTNIASQRGILKAGLKQTGGIHRHVFAFLGPRVAITFRRHRWGLLGWA